MGTMAICLLSGSSQHLACCMFNALYELGYWAKYAEPNISSPIIKAAIQQKYRNGQTKLGIQRKICRSQTLFIQQIITVWIKELNGTHNAFYLSFHRLEKQTRNKKSRHGKSTTKIKTLIHYLTNNDSIIFNSFVCHCWQWRTPLVPETPIIKYFFYHHHYCWQISRKIFLQVFRAENEIPATNSGQHVDKNDRIYFYFQFSFGMDFYSVDYY